MGRCILARVLHVHAHACCLSLPENLWVPVDPVISARGSWSLHDQQKADGSLGIKTAQNTRALTSTESIGDYQGMPKQMRIEGIESEFKIKLYLEV